MAGVHVGDEQSLRHGRLLQRCPPYTIVGGMPAKEIPDAFDKDIRLSLQSCNGGTEY